MGSIIVYSADELARLAQGPPPSMLEIEVWDEGARCVDLLATWRPPLRELALSEESPEARTPLSTGALLTALPMLESLRLAGCPLCIDWSGASHRRLRVLRLESAFGLPSVPPSPLPALERLALTTFFPEPMDDGWNDRLSIEVDRVSGEVVVKGSVFKEAHCAFDHEMVRHGNRASFELKGDPRLVSGLQAEINKALGMRTKDSER